MSGGHFEYEDRKISQVGEELELVVDIHKKAKGKEFADDDYSTEAFYAGIPEDIIKDFEFSGKLLKILGDIVHEIDYYLSGDTGDESYRERVEKIIERLKRFT